MHFFPIIFGLRTFHNPVVGVVEDDQLTGNLVALEIGLSSLSAAMIAPDERVNPQMVIIRKLRMGRPLRKVKTGSRRVLQSRLKPPATFKNSDQHNNDSGHRSQYAKIAVVPGQLRYELEIHPVNTGKQGKWKKYDSCYG